MLGESHTAGVKENQDGGHKEASSGALPLTWEMTKRAAEMWNSKAQPDQYTHWNSWEKKKKVQLERQAIWTKCPAWNKQKHRPKYQKRLPKGVRG